MEKMAKEVRMIESCYTFIAYQIHTKPRRNSKYMKCQHLYLIS